LLFIIGGREGSWAYANVGVLLALAIGALGHLLLARNDIKSQERS
jgi:hypothetical protein